MNSLRRLAQNRLLDVGAIIIAVLGVVKIAVVLPRQVAEYDFAHYYIWSRMMLEGANPYAQSATPWLEKYGFAPYEHRPTATNPPLLLWLFAPFSLLNPKQAFAAWFALQALTLYTILWLTRYLLRGRLSARGWRFLCAGVLAWEAVYLHFCCAQVQLLLGALLLGAYALQMKNQHAIACVMVTLAGLVKPFPLMLLPWFLWRDVRTLRVILGRVAVVLAVGAGVIFATGLQRWNDLIQHALPVVSRYAVEPGYNFSLPAFIANLGSALCGGLPSAAAARGWWIVGQVTGACALVIAYVICFRVDGDRETEFSLLIVAMVAANIVAWGHYFVLLIFPITVAVVRCGVQPSVNKVVALLLVVVALIHLEPWLVRSSTEQRLADSMVNYVPLYGALLLATFLAMTLLHKRTDAERVNL
jgi:hypothetical protein